MIATDTPTSAPHAAAENAATGAARADAADIKTAHALGLNAVTFITGSIGSVIVAGILLALVAALVNQPDWWRGYFAGAVAGLIAAVVSAVPILFLFRQPLTVLMSGYLAIGGLRALAVAAIVIVSVKAGGYPKLPTVAFAGLFYITLAAAEGLLLWSMLSSSRIVTTENKLTTQDNA